MNKNTQWVALLSALTLITFAACTKKPVENEAPTTTITASTPVAAPSAAPTAAAPEAPVTQLKIDDLKVGAGAEATAGKKVTVHYTGTLLNGTKFDSSLDRNQPFTFLLGAGQVIKGWDQGVVGMKVGGKRKLTIPSDMAYGAQQVGDKIPPNSTLLFDIELLKVE